MRHGLGVYGKTVIYIALTASFFGMLGLAQAQEKTEGAQNPVAESEPGRSAFDQRESFKRAINNERERIHQRIEMIRMWSLVSILNLDEATAKSFFPVVNEIRERRVRLAGQINSLKKQLALAASKAENDKEIEELITQYRDKMSELSRLGDEEFDRLSKILNPVQQVQYIVFGDRFHQDLQVIIRQAQSQVEKNRANDEDAESSEKPQDQPEAPKN